MLVSSISVGALATAVAYPLDFVKTRIQIRSEGIGIRNYSIQAGYNPFKVFRQIHETGGGLK
jgi:solute carrier family 25 (mitochondrial oxoglutarate transporter), member 11